MSIHETNSNSSWTTTQGPLQAQENVYQDSTVIWCRIYPYFLQATMQWTMNARYHNMPQIVLLFYKYRFDKKIEATTHELLDITFQCITSRYIFIHVTV